MKQAVYTIFVAFWACVLTVVALDALTPAAEAGDGQETKSTFTLAEVAEHDRLEDCWMAIEGHVYDFTAYIDQHPTPPEVLEPWCGKEATEGMRTKGYGRDHSERAWQMAEQYRVGSLAENGN
ncbi:MAG: cytochrome b5-like heme/steroid binding domain-containing protein [Wenzhouxiangella sp.]|jgi:cytochrome b involved in lipid metabolism|nr:cytochrome b5-like heme/steroid binding domain-containing protein [Wenzhouxiangella sp.]